MCAQFCEESAFAGLMKHVLEEEGGSQEVEKIESKSPSEAFDGESFSREHIAHAFEDVGCRDGEADGVDPSRGGGERIECCAERLEQEGDAPRECLHIGHARG